MNDIWIIPFRQQTPALAHARDLLHTMGQTHPDPFVSLLVVQALQTLDSTSPQYPPAQHVNGRHALDEAVQALLDATRQTSSMREIYRIGAALQLLAELP